MAALLITWDDKVTLNASTEADINVVRDSDMNQIKTVIADHAALIDINTAKVSGTWVPSLVTGDVSAIQNTVTSDISAQTGVKTFTLFDSDITTVGRTSTGDVNHLHFKKDNVDVFKVDVDGVAVAATGVEKGFRFGTGQMGWGEISSGQLGFSTDLVSGHQWKFTSNSFESNSTGGAKMRRSPNASNMTYGHVGDEHTGWTWNSDNNISAFTGAVEAINIDSSQNVTIKNGNFIITNQGAGADPVFSSNNAAQNLDLTGTLTVSASINAVAGNITGQTFTISNVGAGTNPVLSSNDAAKVAALSGGLEIEEGLKLSGSKIEKRSLIFTMSQAQLQAGNTTPLDFILAPGAGKWARISDVSYFYDHNGTNYTGIANIQIFYNSLGSSAGNEVFTITDIEGATDHNSSAIETRGDVAQNDKMIIQADVDAVGNGGDLFIACSYEIIDSN